MNNYLGAAAHIFIFECAVELALKAQAGSPKLCCQSWCKIVIIRIVRIIAIVIKKVVIVIKLALIIVIIIVMAWDNTFIPSLAKGFRGSFQIPRTWL